MLLHIFQFMLHRRNIQQISNHITHLLHFFTDRREIIILIHLISHRLQKLDLSGNDRQRCLQLMCDICREIVPHFIETFQCILAAFQFLDIILHLICHRIEIMCQNTDLLIRSVIFCPHGKITLSQFLRNTGKFFDWLCNPSRLPVHKCTTAQKGKNNHEQQKFFGIEQGTVDFLYIFFHTHIITLIALFQPSK